MPVHPMSALCGFQYAHRGLWDDTIPENSLAAFQRAAEAGFGVELDVRLTRDGVLVVMHDASLLRMCGVNRTVEESTLAELDTLRLSGTDACIPTLQQALEVIGDRVPVIIEVKKAPRMEAVCAAVLPLLTDRPGIYALESFHPLAVRWMRRHAPSIPHGQLVFGGKAQRFRRLKLILNLLLCLFSRPDFIACETGVLSARMLSALRKRCRMLVLWTIRTETEMQKNSSLCDAQIFEGFVPKR